MSVRTELVIVNQLPEELVTAPNIGQSTSSRTNPTNGPWRVNVFLEKLISPLAAILLEPIDSSLETASNILQPADFQSNSSLAASANILEKDQSTPFSSQNSLEFPKPATRHPNQIRPSSTQNQQLSLVDEVKVVEDMLGHQFSPAARNMICRGQIFANLSSEQRIWNLIHNFRYVESIAHSPVEHLQETIQRIDSLFFKTDQRLRSVEWLAACADPIRKLHTPIQLRPFVRKIYREVESAELFVERLGSGFIKEHHLTETTTYNGTLAGKTEYVYKLVHLFENQVQEFMYDIGDSMAATKILSAQLLRQVKLGNANQY